MMAKTTIYELWREVLLKRFVKCKGGRYGGCKHIGAAMYSLEALHSSRDSVTSGSCQWIRKPLSDTGPCEVKEVIQENEVT